MANEDYTLEWDASHASAMLDRVMEALSDGQVHVFFQDTVEGWLRDRARRRFRSEGDDASGAWAPLSDETIRRRLQKGYRANPINYREGELWEYVANGQGQSENEGDEIVMYFPGADAMGELGYKFRMAQKGGKRKGGKGAPARPVAAVNDTDQTYITESFWQNIERHVG